jgi:hypothetical protein
MKREQSMNDIDIRWLHEKDKNTLFLKKNISYKNAKKR